MTTLQDRLRAHASIYSSFKITSSLFIEAANALDDKRRDFFRSLDDAEVKREAHRQMESNVSVGHRPGIELAEKSDASMWAFIKSTPPEVTADNFASDEEFTIYKLGLDSLAPGIKATANSHTYAMLKAGAAMAVSAVNRFDMRRQVALQEHIDTADETISALTNTLDNRVLERNTARERVAEMEIQAHRDAEMRAAERRGAAEDDAIIKEWNAWTNTFPFVTAGMTWEQARETISAAVKSRDFNANAYAEARAELDRIAEAIGCDQHTSTILTSVMEMKREYDGAIAALAEALSDKTRERDEARQAAKVSMTWEQARETISAAVKTG